VVEKGSYYARTVDGWRAIVRQTHKNRVCEGSCRGVEPISLTNIGGYILPTEWIYGGIGVLVFLVVLLFIPRGGKKKEKLGDVLETSEIQTFIRAFESSGLYSILRPIGEEAGHISFEYGGQDWSPAKTNPFVPAGRAIREFDWPVGASSCLDPQQLHGSRDVDDPTPMIQEAQHWYRALRSALGQLGVSLKNPFLILLLVVVVLMGLFGGYVLGNVYPIRTPP